MLGGLVANLCVEMAEVAVIGDISIECIWNGNESSTYAIWSFGTRALPRSERV